MAWIDSIIARADEAQRLYEEKRALHNEAIDTELHELDTIVKYDLVPGMPIAKAQQAIMLSQIRLLRKQWEALRIE
jgi:hypothetical protein